VDSSERLDISGGIEKATKWEQLMISGLPKGAVYHMA